jgi:hypothetical protein
MNMIEDIEKLYASALAGLPPSSEIPRTLHCGHDAYVGLLCEAAGPGLATPPPVSWASAVDIVLGGNTSTPGEWILYAADGSEMKRGDVTQVTE